jgi:negative regulator of sigma E activity
MWFRRVVDVAFAVAVVLGVIVLLAAFFAGR